MGWALPSPIPGILQDGSSPIPSHGFSASSQLRFSRIFFPLFPGNFAGAALGRGAAPAALPEHPVPAWGAIKGSGMDRERREFARTAPRRSPAGENPPRPERPTSSTGGNSSAAGFTRIFIFLKLFFFYSPPLPTQRFRSSGCSQRRSQPGGGVGGKKKKGMRGGFGKIRSFSSHAPPGAAAREL